MPFDLVAVGSRLSATAGQLWARTYYEDPRKAPGRFDLVTPNSAVDARGSELKIRKKLIKSKLCGRLL
jgi:hypothetical protein